MEFTCSRDSREAGAVRRAQKLKRLSSWILGIFAVLGAGSFLLYLTDGGEAGFGLIHGLTTFLMGGLFAWILRVTARTLTLRAEKSPKPTHLSVDGDILSCGEKRIDLMKTTICYSGEDNTLLFTGGVPEGVSAADHDFKDDVCDLLLRDDYTPSLRTYLLARGFLLHDWDNQEDPACQRPEVFSKG